MAYRARRGKLAYKILIGFLVTSLVPLGFVCYNLIKISQSSLQKQTLAMQVSMAVGFADTASKYVSTFESVLSETASMGDFTSMNPAQQRQYLQKILALHPAVLELSVANAKGQETLRVSRYAGAGAPLRDLSRKDFFLAAMARGQYVGGLERFQGLYPDVRVAVAILPPQGSSPVGVLSGAISLNGLSSMLAMEFPSTGQRRAAVAAPDGFLIADSDPREVYKPDARLSDDVLRIVSTQSGGDGGGEIHLPDGTRLLGAYAYVKDLGWIVYIQEPLNLAYQSALQMRSQVLKVVIWVVLIVVLLALALSSNITHPLRLLREAAEKLSRGEFEDLPQMLMTNDEIGDLAQTFSTMSESLREKTGELINAKQELEKSARILETRVEARTRELKAAQDELIKKERLAAVGQMASVVGHEIRNPLAVINNSVYFLKTKLAQVLQGDPKLSKHVKIIESEIQQANGIINEILTYSRSRDLKPERVALNTWLEDVLSVYPFPPHIRVDKVFCAENPPVDIDTTEMQQAIRNIIGNAIEVMPASGAIRARTTMSGRDAVCLELADSGPGMPRDVLDKIFTPFFTTKARGTGLGLAVVRKVMDRHKGRVEVESEAGRGTTFRLYLPVAAAVRSVQA
ncbi:MAG: HAMP domain-containing protein [Elusimicrobia bacterium]|nr:HAMP domain-containing protein [Elusimicrobiota bacterium]